MSRPEGCQPFGDLATAIELIDKGLSLGDVCRELWIDKNKLKWLLRTNGYGEVISHGMGEGKRWGDYTDNRSGS